MASGLVYAVSACALWALCFVAPIVLDKFSPTAIALGRYAAFGVISLCITPAAWKGLKALSWVDWKAAAALSVIGNLAYYVLLASAIQLIDVPGPTVVIGLLPLTIPILANWRNRELQWRDLVLPLCVLGVGLLLVNAYEYRRFASERADVGYLGGLTLAIAALICWTWYGVVNAGWLKARPQISATAWTVAQGITLLPIVLAIALLGTIANVVAPGAGFQSVSAGGWKDFVVVSLLVGLGSSWLATFCWTHASKLLPTTIAGQLIVFETIAAVLYGLLYRARWPSGELVGGVALLCIGVVLGVRAFQLHRTDER